MRTAEAVDAEAEQYLRRVAAVLSRLGYQVTERFTEGVGVLIDPDHVIRVGLNGPVVDLIWDTTSWKAVTYPLSGGTHNDELSTVLSTERLPAADAVGRAAQSVLDEARRRWGKPDPVQTWTFFGHWDNARVVVDAVVPGVIADDREDDGRWPAGLWVGLGGGTTVDQAEVAAVAAFEQDPDDVADLVAQDAAVGLPGWTRVTSEPEENTVAWAGKRLTDVPPATRLQVSTAAGVLLVALARAVSNGDPEVTWEQLLESLLAELIDTVHGPGVAREADALLCWWRELTDEERALSGVSLEDSRA